MKKLLHTQRRGLALWLLTLMCLASVNVWGQETKVIDFSNGLPSDWSKTGTVAKQNYAGKSCTQLQTAATIKSPVFTEAFSSVKIHLTRSSNGTTFTFSYQIEGNEPVEIKTYTASDVEKVISKTTRLKYLKPHKFQIASSYSLLKKHHII